MCCFTSHRFLRVVALYASSCMLIKPSYPALAPSRDTQWSHVVQIFLLIFATGMVLVAGVLLGGYQLCVNGLKYPLHLFIIQIYHRYQRIQKKIRSWTSSTSNVLSGMNLSILYSNLLFSTQNLDAGMSVVMLRS